MGYEYNGLIPQQTAPKNAKRIGVYDSGGSRILTVPLGRLSPVRKTKLYSFGLVSDVHLWKVEPDWKANRKFRNALSYFQANGCSMCIHCGDITNTGFYDSRKLDDGSTEIFFDDAQMKVYKTICEEYTIPVYGLCGNHESYYSKSVANHLDELEDCTGKRALSYTVTSAEESEINARVSAVGDDVFILLGQPSGSVAMSDADLQWLGETLAANKDKRCFVFVHAYIEEDSGDPLDVRENSIFDYWGEAKTTAFMNLLQQHRNVILFHGHSHMKFECQELDRHANYTERNGFKSVHVPSLAIPRDVDIENKKSVDDRSASQGYIVDVYEDCIVLNGLDFISEKPVPLGTYKIDTPI